VTNLTTTLVLFRDRALEKAGAILDGTAETMADRIRDRTPVDTGRARSGWEVQNRSRDHRTIHNEVPYIWSLEMGHSQQAPHGMAGITVLEFQDIVEEVANEHR
jgi:hypothetical protein